MAIQDVGQGWGDLKCGLTEWHCPKCKVNYPVSAWEVSNGEINGHRIQGRNCPCATCDFKAYSHSDSMLMIPLPAVKTTVLTAPLVIKKRSHHKKIVKKSSKGKPK